MKDFRTLTKLDIPHIDSPALNALAVLAAESALSFGLALTGGAVRNVALGLDRPTDHDIIVFDFDPSTYPTFLDAICHTLADAGYDLVQVNDAGEYDYANVAAVAQFSHAVYPEVDVLFHPFDSTLQHVLAKHDFNINNYAVVIDDICDSERQTAYFVGPNPQGVLIRQPHQERIGFIRQAHIVAIADEAGWAVPPRYRGSPWAMLDLFEE